MGHTGLGVHSIVYCKECLASVQHPAAVQSLKVLLQAHSHAGRGGVEDIVQHPSRWLEVHILQENVSPFPKIQA